MTASESTIRWISRLRVCGFKAPHRFAVPDAEPCPPVGSTNRRSQERSNQTAHVRGHLLRISITVYHTAAVGITACPLQQGGTDDVEVAEGFRGIFIAVSSDLPACTRDFDRAVEDHGEVGHGSSDDDCRDLIVDAGKVSVGDRHLVSECGIQIAVGYDPVTSFHRRSNNASHMIVTRGAHEKQLLHRRQQMIRTDEDRPYRGSEPTAVGFLRPDDALAQVAKVLDEHFGLPGLAASIDTLNAYERHK